ncbi:hypothetical protein [Chryseosolibacter indicus]|uniref:Uncharacterized protein n=1 Tax=Chryseosolibacter indicus TaxID=2782351 RepID=A0ABS5VQ40_9BACT|nr:hypothetical protein [Chryseosolibacter indicus]MBT1702965.1 hypothetical protein [Chryseosolibacter indicus]
MQTIKVLYGNVLSDLVSEDQLFEAADLNGIGITEVLVPGVTLSIPDQQPARLNDETLPKAVKQRTAQAVAGQTWIDLAMQEVGDESRLFELCDLNDASITEEVEAGRVIQAMRVEQDKQNIVNVLRPLKPSSMYYKVGDPAPEGIEYWAIELDFIVS